MLSGEVLGVREDGRQGQKRENTDMHGDLNVCSGEILEVWDSLW